MGPDNAHEHAPSLATSEKPNLRIQRLPQDVINRIAAGEVVVRPSAALKELLENSLDAGAKSITVSARDGGLKLLQVCDDGCGISREDLPLLCERFATSKITKVDDLLNVATFGFRGEALASISHVARLSVVTKTAESALSYSAIYLDGSLRTSPKACAGVNGTTLIIEDLFYNLPTRRAALRSPSDEYRAIVDVVARYAIRYPHVAFICRRQATTSSRASPPADVRTDIGANALTNIRSSFGGVIADETVPVDVRIENADATAKAIVSAANFSMKRGIYIFFINGRLVDCNPLKKAIASAYAPFLPKASQPFVYIDITLPQHDVDVNVHPMKKEVRFLHEESIIEAIIGAITDKLKSSETSRTFLAQSVVLHPEAVNDTFIGKMPSSRLDTLQARSAENIIKSNVSEERTEKINTDVEGRKSQKDSEDRQGLQSLGTVKASEGGSCTDGSVYANIDLVAPISNTLPSSKPKRSVQSVLTPSEEGKTTSEGKKGRMYAKDKVRINSKAPVGLLDQFLTPDSKSWRPGGAESTCKRQRRRQGAMPLLTSVELLLDECRRSAHQGLTQILREHTFVGIASRRFVLIQHGTQLLLADTDALVTHLMYGQILMRFADHDVIELRPAAPVMRLIQAHIDGLPVSYSGFITDAESCANVLLERAPMLLEYFGLHVVGDDAVSSKVVWIPQLFNGVVPDVRGMGSFLFDVALHTDWTEESTCFRAIATAFARWYGKKWQPAQDGGSADKPVLPQNEDWHSEQREWTLRHILFSNMRNDYYPPKTFHTRQVIQEITSTAKLYKIFERC